MCRDRKPIRFLALAFLLIVVLWEVLGQVSEGRALSISDEKVLGRRILEEVREQLPLVNDGEVLTYIQSVGNRVTRQLTDTPFQYQFFLINEATPNAFAIPGGYIFIYRGLISMMTSEGELAGILSHEIGHIQARHISHRIEQSKILNVAAIVATLAGVFLGGGGDASRALATGAMAGVKSLELKYSRDDEEEADRLGFHYLVSAGYDAQDMVGVMRKMNRMHWQSDSRIPSYLLTHPALAERVGYLETMVEKEQTRDSRPSRQSPLGDFPLMQAALVGKYESPEVALDRLHALQRQKDFSTVAAYGLGCLYLRQGRVEQAVTQLREVASQKANSPMVLSSLGAAYFQQGQLQEAKKVLTTALLLDPNSPAIHFHLASVFREQGQPQEALLHLRKAEQLAPMLPEIDYHLGVLLGQTQEYGLAHYHLGHYYAYQKDWKLAKFHYEKALRLLSHSPAVVDELEEELKKIDREKYKATRQAASPKSAAPNRWLPGTLSAR
jgi:beta-barrel assembly-enhancing protease